MATRRYWLALLGLNVALAAIAAALAPSAVGVTADRLGYEYVAQHGLQPDCPHSIYCYRVLVPALVGWIPLPAVLTWRVFAVLANGLTGLVLGRITSLLVTSDLAPLLAAVLFQTSFGATFALFDPFTPDAAAFLASSLVAWAWLRQRPWVALVVGLVGVFAKESVLLPLGAAALAALLPTRVPAWRNWLMSAALPAAVLLTFHATMDLFARWSEAGNASADLLHGAFIARWLADPTLTTTARVFYVFIPFAFAWLFAVLGAANVSSSQARRLALTTLVLLPLLVYVQTVERALAMAFYVVIPLAAAWLSTRPAPLAVLVAALNGLLTARTGLSPSVLPPVPLLLGAAAVASALLCWAGRPITFRRHPVADAP